MLTRSKEAFAGFIEPYDSCLLTLIIAEDEEEENQHDGRDCGYKYYDPIING